MIVNACLGGPLQVFRLVVMLKHHRDTVNALHRPGAEAYIDFGQVNENESFFEVAAQSAAQYE